MGQRPVFKHYSVENGLPSSRIHYAHQDSKGYLWFATDRGVCRFDGYSFKTYTSEDGLCDNTVFGIYEDRKERIWFYTFSGQLSYFYDNQIYSHTANDWLKEKLNPEIIVSMHVDAEDTVWLGLTNGKGYCKLPPFQEQGLGQLKAVEDTSIYIKEVGKDGLIYGHSYSPGFQPSPNIKILNGHTGTNGRLPASRPNHTNSATAVIKTREGNYWISYQDQVCLSGSSGFERCLEVPHMVTNGLLVDDHGDLWVGTMNGGSYCFAKDGSTDHQPAQFLAGRSVSTLLQDREGGLWFGTLSDGIYYLPSTEFLTFSESQGLSDDRIISIAGNDSTLWAGSHDGTLHKIVKDPKLGYQIDHVLWLSEINKLFLKNGHDLHVSSISGSYQIDSSGVANLLSDVSILTYATDQKGNLWVGTFNELYRFNDSLFQLSPVGFNRRVNAVWADKQNTIWIGSLDGLWSYEDGKFNYHGHKNPLFRNRITDIKSGPGKTLIIATLGGGVLLKNGDQVEQITTSDGLVSNLCNGVFMDDSDLWVATNSGLSRVPNLHVGTGINAIESYTTREGISSNEVREVFVRGNEVWAATNKGIVMFDKTRVKPIPSPPPVYITSIRINDRDTILTNPFHLSYDHRSIAIDFVGLGYKNAGNVEYRYRMIGLDSHWVTTRHPSVQYTTLPDGDYVFLVTARNNNGVWNENPATISFHIAPPYWQEWWFIGLVMLTIVAIIWFFFYFRYRSFKLQTLLQRKTFESEQKALRSQMNPHFIFNSLNSIQQLISENDRVFAVKNISKFAKLMRMTLNNSKKSAVTLAEEIETLQLYLEMESLRFEDKFEYIIKIGSNIDLETTEIPPMLIQPYVENAIWHGLMNKPQRAGKVEIKLDEASDMMVCTVTDDGVGRKRAMELKGKSWKNHESSGMEITRERLKILNATRNSQLSVKVTDLENKDNVPLGTKVEIFIPLDY